eukprot:6614136-Pyramimonas_sp.AAC.1
MRRTIARKRKRRSRAQKEGDAPAGPFFSRLMELIGTSASLGFRSRWRVGTSIGDRRGRGRRGSRSKEGGGRADYI